MDAVWTEEQIKYLIEKYPTTDWEDIAEVIKKDRTQIKAKARSLKLKKKTPQVNEKYGKLTIKEIYQEKCKRQNRSYALCDCDCGNNNCRIRLSDLFRGEIQSCGCRHIFNSRNGQVVYENGTHGLTGAPIHNRWSSMISRCTNPNLKVYKWYGGKGVKVCSEWMEFINFYNWAMANGYRDDLTIDRIDSNGDYCPENVRFVTMKEQANNTSWNKHYELWGETKTISQWMDHPKCVIKKYSIVLRRLLRGWDLERALTTPEMYNKYSFKKNNPPENSVLPIEQQNS